MLHATIWGLTPAVARVLIRLDDGSDLEALIVRTDAVQNDYSVAFDVPGDIPCGRSVQRLVRTRRKMVARRASTARFRTRPPCWRERSLQPDASTTPVPGTATSSATKTPGRHIHTTRTASASCMWRRGVPFIDDCTRQERP